MEQLINDSHAVNVVLFGTGLPTYERIYEPMVESCKEKYLDAEGNEQERTVWYYRTLDEKEIYAFRSSYTKPYVYTLICEKDMSEAELKALFPVIEGASESEDIPFYSEVYRSESGKVAYAIPYVEAEPEYYYSTGSSEDYDTVRFDSGYDSIDDIKALAQTVYSRNYCLSLYSVLFDGIALGDSIQLAQYSEVASVGGSFLGQLREYEPLFTEQRVYMFETARINKWGSNSKFVRVLINSYLPSAPNQIIETEIDLVLQDGVWLLDVPTF